MIRANNWGATTPAAIAAGMRVYDALPPALRLALRHCPVDTSAAAVGRRFVRAAADGRGDAAAVEATLLALDRECVRAFGRSFLDDL